MAITSTHQTRNHTYEYNIEHIPHMSHTENIGALALPTPNIDSSRYEQV
jgi:hypothetical protein